MFYFVTKLRDLYNGIVLFVYVFRLSGYFGIKEVIFK